MQPVARFMPASLPRVCSPTLPRPPARLWLHEIKHDGFRVIARKEAEWDADRLCDYALAKLR